MPSPCSGMPSPCSGMPSPCSGMPSSCSGMPSPCSGMLSPCSGMPSSSAASSAWAISARSLSVRSEKHSSISARIASSSCTAPSSGSALSSSSSKSLAAPAAVGCSLAGIGPSPATVGTPSLCKHFLGSTGEPRSGSLRSSADPAGGDGGSPSGDLRWNPSPAGTAKDFGGSPSGEHGVLPSPAGTAKDFSPHALLSAAGPPADLWWTSRRRGGCGLSVTVSVGLGSACCFAGGVWASWASWVLSPCGALAEALGVTLGLAPPSAAVSCRRSSSANSLAPAKSNTTWAMSAAKSSDLAVGCMWAAVSCPRSYSALLVWPSVRYLVREVEGTRPLMRMDLLCRSP